MMTVQMQEVFCFGYWKREFDAYGEDYINSESFRITKIIDCDSESYEISVNSGMFCRFVVPRDALEGLKRILYDLNWNYEYWGDRTVEENRWELKMDLPDLKFRSRGSNAYPADYGQVRDAILREVKALLWKHSGMQALEAFGGNTWPIHAGQYLVYQARHEMHDKYYFYYNDQQIGTAVSQTAPDFPVTIQDGDLHLYTELIDRYPLRYRMILRQTPTGQVSAGRLERGTYQNRYKLWIDSECIDVCVCDQSFSFSRGQQEIARLTKANDKDRDYFILRSKVRLEYYMSVREALPRNLATLLLSFPFLKIML